MSDTLFPVQDKARRRRTDPTSSFWAAQGIDVNKRQGMVLSAFVGLEDATHDQLIDKAREMFGDVAESTIRTGVSELEAMGLVEWTGLHGFSKRGNKAQLYRRVVK